MDLTKANIIGEVVFKFELCLHFIFNDLKNYLN